MSIAADEQPHSKASMTSASTDDASVAPKPRPAQPAPTRPARDIVVIGASAGGVAALKALLAAMPPDFGGMVFIVLHTSPESAGQLAAVLGRRAPLPVLTAEEGQPIIAGRVHVAPPDCHMLLEHGRVRVVRGPKENRHRPAIDPLFRSAAWAYGPRVVGVVLTGCLDDGAAGLWAIKSCNGTTVVQDPADADHPQMPENALLYSKVDHCVPLDQIASLLVQLAHAPVDEPHTPPATLKTEIEFAKMNNGMPEMASLGKLSAFTCPACKGALWELHDGDLLRYRCHTGHAYSKETLLEEQAEVIENALYSALRAVQEKAAVLRRLGARWTDLYPHAHADYERKAAEMEESAEVLRGLLGRGGP
jgi:two-component system chemotaxis response regulator CheB